MTEANVNHLDGGTLAAALTSGIHRVLAEQELLNKINVFPVADSDTGTNLGLSLGAALGVLGAPGEKHLGTMLAALADTLLDASRGNSGAIVAQFFQGISDSAGEMTRFTTYTFARAVATGSEYAHDALSKPREGTILSVIKAFTDSVSSHLAEVRDATFPAILDEAVARVDEALANTPNQLDVLRKAGVVDAGAKGFAELVTGVADYLREGIVVPLPDNSIGHTTESGVEFVASDDESRYRFCTECIVTGADIDRRKLREAMSALGDSLVLAGTKRKAKIHIHADEPELVFDTARRFGELSAEKADDMQRQQHAIRDGGQRFAVIVDSGADISDEDMERLDIHMVPCRIQFGNHAYLDKVSITIGEFYVELANNPNHPTTSQPAPGDFRRQFQFLASHFDDVISLNVTGAASGTCEAARLAAQRSNARGTIHVVDSCNGSLGQGQLAVFAAECAAAGLDIDTTLAALREQVPVTKSYAIVHDTLYAMRGGRLPKWVHTVARLLRLIPIIHTMPNGNIGLAGCLVGRHNRINRFARFVARRMPQGPVDVGIGHALCEDDARRLEECLREQVPGIRKLVVTGLGPAIGVHGGPGSLLIAVRPWISAQDVPCRDD